MKIDQIKSEAVTARFSGRSQNLTYYYLLLHKVHNPTLTLGYSETRKLQKQEARRSMPMQDRNATHNIHWAVTYYPELI